jgi:hypothetical protein
VRLTPFGYSRGDLDTILMRQIDGKGGLIRPPDLTMKSVRDEPDANCR